MYEWFFEPFVGIEMTHAMFFMDNDVLEGKTGGKAQGKYYNIWTENIMI